MTKAVQMSLATTLMHSLIILCNDSLLAIKFFIFFSLSSPLSRAFRFDNARQSCSKPSRQPRGRARCFDDGERARRPPRRERETEDVRQGAHLRASKRAPASRSTHVAKKEDSEAKGRIFNLRPTKQVKGQAGRDGGREHPGSGQAPARGVGESP